MASRMKPKERKEQLLSIALDVSRRIGYQHITRNDVAEKAGVTINLINNYFGTMPRFRRTIMRAAIKNEVLEVIAQGLICGDAQAKKADPKLKKKALQTYAG